MRVSSWCCTKRGAGARTTGCSGTALARQRTPACKEPTMRLVKVSAPQGKGPDLARIAFDCGIEDVSIHQVTQHKAGSQPAARDVLDAKLSTPAAKAFIDALVHAPF